MSANLVRYYNTGGFDAGGTHFQSPSPYPITWWGIFNEPNGNGLTPQDYVDLYNTMVPVMAQADPSIKFAAVELSDYGPDAESILPAFVSSVTAPVDVLATHFYSTCNQTDHRRHRLSNGARVWRAKWSNIYSQLATRPDLAAVPVWVTENNVNADYALSNGLSNCNGTPFVLDPRGTSPFFAAWRSLVFRDARRSRRPGALSLGLFVQRRNLARPDSSGQPVPSAIGSIIISLTGCLRRLVRTFCKSTSSGCCLWIDHAGAMHGLDTHTLALRNPDGSVVILMSNHAIQKIYTDNNGPGVGTCG